MKATEKRNLVKGKKNNSFVWQLKLEENIHIKKLWGEETRLKECTDHSLHKRRAS